MGRRVVGGTALWLDRDAFVCHGYWCAWGELWLVPRRCPSRGRGPYNMRICRALLDDPSLWERDDLLEQKKHVHSREGSMGTVSRIQSPRYSESDAAGPGSLSG